ncbi:MAG: hypothetical protein FD167_5376, partial [bacterium]
MKRFKLIIILIVLVFMPVFFVNFEILTINPKAKAQVQNTTPPTMLALTRLGDPLPGIDSKILGRFQSGKFEFERDHLIEEGLGPTFNDFSCVACHGFPVTGGSLDAIDDITFRIGRITRGKYNDLERLGGEPLSSKKVVDGCEPQMVPAKAQFVSPRAAQQLFGSGLIDAISEAIILSNADPDDTDKDGISGRPNMVFSPRFNEIRVGRFGWKAHWPTLIDFTGDAYIVEIGISSPDFPRNRVTNGKKSICDTANGPEDFDGRVTNTFFDFMTLLAPPPQNQLDTSATNGKAIFHSIGCVKCHIPTLRTANLSERPDLITQVLANQEANLYSDLLLHDMGDELRDGIQTGIALGSEWRTQPLWGLSSKKFFLHDGRTTDVSKAISAHGGEAAASRDRFLKL